VAGRLALMLGAVLGPLAVQAPPRTS